MRVENLIWSGYPTTFVSDLSSTGGTSSTHPPIDGCSDTGDTSYAQFSSSKQDVRNYYYHFDIQGISQYATITSVACLIKARSSATGNNYMGYAQLCVGTTNKGSETQINTINDTTPISLSPGTGWSLSDFENLNIRVAPNRGTNNRQIRFYGANLTIDYSITYYAITTSSSAQGVTISSSASEVESGNSATITVTTNNFSNVIVKKDGVDITNQFVSINGTFRYTHSNVNADAVFTVETKSSIDKKLLLKANGLWNEVSKVYKKENNSWIEQNDFTDIFNNETIYVKD